MNNRERQRGEISIYIKVILIVVACLIFGAIIVYTNRRNEQESKRLEQVAKDYKELKKNYCFTLLGDEATEEDDFLISVYDVLDNRHEGEIIVDSETFCDDAKLVSGYSNTEVTASLNVSCTLSEGDIAVLQFKAQTESGAGYLNVSCGEDDFSVWVSETAATFYIPISGACSISEIYFEMDASDFVKTSFNEVYLVKYEDTAMTDLRVGVYSDYECDTTVIAAEDYVLDENVSQCLAHDGYLYALYSGKLGVYKISDSGYEMVAEYSGMGDTGDMVFNEDKSAIIVSAKINGIYIFDISEPENLTCVSHYATLKYSAGLCVADQYLFVCNRYFGIEVVNISDISNPVYVSQIGSDSVYIDCCVSDGYLYVGVFEQKRIDVYDITDLNNADLVSQIFLDGNAYGVTVLDGVLYAATARDSGETSNHSNDLSDYGKGTGNGLEIYDVSDPVNPIHLSTSKTLGRLSYSGNATWDVVVSDNYAYLSNRYNGVYVFDVSDPINPICVDIIEIEAESNSSFYESLDSENYAFPYDTEDVSRGCVCHVWPQDGCLYIAAVNMGVYKIEADYMSEIDQTDHATYSVSEKTTSTPTVEDCEVELYETEASIFAVAEYEGYYYVASGDSGIDILDDDLLNIAHYDTDYAVLDIKAAAGYLFTAESEGGVGIWTISGNTLERISTYGQLTNVCYSSVEVTDDGNYILTQSFINSYAIIDATDKYNPVQSENTIINIGSTMYRNLCAGMVDGYLCAYGASSLGWYYYDGSTLKYVRNVDNSFYSERGGMCAAGDKAVYICSGGYYYYDPYTNTTSKKITVDDVELEGKCFSNGSLLVVVDEDSGYVWLINIEDIDNPYCVAEFEIEGNPDIGMFDGDYLLIPCRNYGLLRIDISDLV